MFRSCMAKISCARVCVSALRLAVVLGGCWSGGHAVEAKLGSCTAVSGADNDCRRIQQDPSAGLSSGGRHQDRLTGAPLFQPETLSRPSHWTVDHELQCSKFLQHARQAYRHTRYDTYLQPLGDVCAGLPEWFGRGDKYVTLRDHSTTESPLDVEADNSRVCLLIVKGQPCKGKCCLPVDRAIGCVSTLTVVALVQLILHLGAQRVQYYRSDDLLRIIKQPCEISYTVQGLVAFRGSEATLHAWLDGGGPSTHVTRNCARLWLSSPQFVINARGLDKGEEVHQYHRVYTSLLPPAFRCSARAVLEVGLGHVETMGYAAGESLRGWRQMFPLANITGLDINSTSVRETVGARLQTHVCDTQNVSLTRRILRGSSFDLIIDDGLHTLPGQRGTLRALWPHLRLGGFYVVEDMENATTAFELAQHLAHGVAVGTRGVKDWLVLSVRTSKSLPFAERRE
eukprot:gnl/TRDRNA2_/TRDRNA2_199554_c0_seq1.p1 gnl/TRDRNA2_/TRDRNA2_199554_c0~~gnl/TRDRNA2_/TRDRNA2_199554_c0_seq1.p1  ORF type:complete len:455 (+),score=15.72 gnl/TRDRNA2_/TRDRNA2_199554_c0_seq1:159-1523(+)